MNKNALRVFVVLTSISTLVGVQQNAEAAIFKCVNAKAEVYYNDKPCPYDEVERQLNNVKDPAGGYIPPAFKADIKTQGSKGIVVGEKSNDNNTERSEDLNDSENVNNGNDDGESSGSNNLDDDGDDNVAVKAKKSGSIKRTKPKGVRKNPLPTVPLKKEKVTKEPRSKIS